MRKISIAFFSLMTILAFAEVKQVTVTGQAALELFDRIERTGVERDTWTDNSGVDHINLYVRKMVCDYNTHTEPNPAMCTILPGYMKKPILSEGLKARKIISAMYPVIQAGEPNGIYFGDCAMGKCTDDMGNIACYFKSNDTAHATCTVDAGSDY